jgi:hypothetical protein
MHSTTQGHSGKSFKIGVTKEIVSYSTVSLTLMSHIQTQKSWRILSHMRKCFRAQNRVPGGDI